MNDEQRKQIRDNAKYLRQVRAIDPEEIQEYVSGQPHPAAVTQVLREAAPDLGLVERPDGLFEPVAEDSLDLRFEGVDSLPQHLRRKVADLLVEELGPGWPDGESGAKLRETIRDFKRRYLRGEVVTYDTPTALGYAIYHLPTAFAELQYVFSELATQEPVPEHLRVLDVGAGVGGPALGLDALVPEAALVEYHAVEPSDAATVLDEFLEKTGRNFHPTVHRERIEAFDPGGDEEPFDILLFANVLSELDQPADVVDALLDHLAPDGTVIALAPADKNTATHLRKVERTLERDADITVYAPTVRLWPGQQPGSESWSFRREPDLEVPSFQRRLDEGERTPDEKSRESSGADTIQPPSSGEFVNVDVQYAYTLLRTDGKQAVRFRPDADTTAKMAETEKHVTERIDCVTIKLSHNLSDGDNQLYLLGDGSQKIDHFAVLTSASALNRDLETSEYGDLLVLENVLVLWNDDEDAYNLVVDGETIVDRVPT